MKTTLIGAAFALLLFFTGCSTAKTAANPESSEAPPAEPSSEVSSVSSSVPSSSDPVSSGEPAGPPDTLAAMTPVAELPQPYTGQVAAQRGDVVFSKSQASNTATLDAFVTSVNQKRAAQVRITLWDDANGPFFRDLVYDGNNLIAYYDDTGANNSGERKTSVSEFTGVRLEETHNETYNATFIDFYLTGGVDAQERKVCSYTKQAVSIPTAPASSSSSSAPSGSSVQSGSPVPSSSAPASEEVPSSSAASSHVVEQDGTVTMTTSQHSYEPDIQKIKISVNNSSDRRIVYGEEFSLERRESGEWKTVTPSREQLFNDIAIIVDAGGASDYLMGLSDYDSPLSTGRYRVLKEYFYEGKSAQKYTVYSDFEIVATTDSLKLDSPLEISVTMNGSSNSTMLTRTQKYEGRSTVTYLSSLLTKFKPLPPDWELGSAGGNSSAAIQLIYTDGSSIELIMDPNSSHITDGGRWEPITIVIYDRQRYYAEAEVYSLLQKCVTAAAGELASSSK